MEDNAKIILLKVIQINRVALYRFMNSKPHALFTKDKKTLSLSHDIHDSKSNI